MVDGVLPGENDLGDGDKGVALLEEGLDDGGQGLRGVEGGVVEQDNGPGLSWSAAKESSCNTGGLGVYKSSFLANKLR